MATNITYLLGAGASANALPTINELPVRLENFKEALYDKLNGSRKNKDGVRQHVTLSGHAEFPNDGIKGLANELINDIEWLIERLDNHTTVDTLAKRLYLHTEEHWNLERLKRTLVTYFLYEQGIKHGDIRPEQKKELPDKRYDSLIATIISSKIDDLTLPGNYKIITWNYDIQFELALNRYVAGEINDIQDTIQSIPTSDFLNNERKVELENFALVKLNGVAFHNSQRPFFGRYTPDDGDEDENKRHTIFYADLCQLHRSLTREDLKIFTYSWENPQEFEYTHPRKIDVKGEAIRIMHETQILVVIGYSFPLFNRGVDKDLFTKCPKLQKVYIQDSNAENIKSLLQSSFPILTERNKVFQPTRFQNVTREKLFAETDYKIPIDVITDVRQFFIPPEADI